PAMGGEVHVIQRDHAHLPAQVLLGDTLGMDDDIVAHRVPSCRTMALPSASFSDALTTISSPAARPLLMAMPLPTGLPSSTRRRVTLSPSTTKTAPSRTADMGTAMAVAAVVEPAGA